MEVIDETEVEVANLIIELGEGRELDAGLLQVLSKFASLPAMFSSNEKAFFHDFLTQPNPHKLEDWKLIKFIKLATMANVIVRVLGKPHLHVVSTDKSRVNLIRLLGESYKNAKNSNLTPVFGDKNSSKNIETVYVNLAIVQKEDDNKESSKEKMTSFRECRMLSSHEQIYGKKEDYPISKLLSPILNQNGELTNPTPKNILIEGWAGIGKTVLCQYLANTWARGVQEKEKRWWLDETTVVIWIRLRNLASYDEQNCSLGEVVRRECLGVEDSKNENYPSAIQIEADLAALGDKVVLLLDGFDEVAGWYNEIKESNHQLLTARSELLKFELLGARHKYRIILTTRPNRVSQIDSMFTRHLETIGFKDTNIEDYVREYFKETPQRGELLLSSMRSNVNVWGIAHIPVNLALICLVWKLSTEKPEMVELMKLTMTELYTEVIILLLRRDWMKHPVDENGSSILFEHLTTDVLLLNVDSIKIERFENTLHQYPMKLDFLRELAWNAQTSPHQDILVPGGEVLKVLNKHFPELIWPVQQMNKLSDIKSLGLLETQIGLEEISIEQNSFYFPHLTFQEYFAAKYWVRNYCSEREEERREAENLFKRYKYYPRFEVVWWFVAGIISKDSQERLSEFFKLIQGEPREFIGLKQICLLIRCLEECKLSLNNNDQLKCMINEVCGWLEWSFRQDNLQDEFGSVSKPEIHYSAIKHSPHVYSHIKIRKFIIKNLNSLNERRVWGVLYFIKTVELKLPQVTDHLLNFLLKAKDHLLEDCIQYLLSIELSKEQTDLFVSNCMQGLLGQNPKMRENTLRALGKLPWDKCSLECVEKCAKTCLEQLENNCKDVRFIGVDIFVYLPWDKLSHYFITRLMDRYLIMFLNGDIQQAVKVITKLPWHLFKLKYKTRIFDFVLKCMEHENHFVSITILDIIKNLPWKLLSQDYAIKFLDIFMNMVGVNIVENIKKLLKIIGMFEWDLLSNLQTVRLLKFVRYQLQNQDQEIYLATIRVLKVVPWQRTSIIDAVFEVMKDLILSTIDCTDQCCQDEIIATISVFPIEQFSSDQIINVIMFLSNNVLMSSNKDAFLRNIAQSSLKKLKWDRLTVEQSNEIVRLCLDRLDNEDIDEQYAALGIIGGFPLCKAPEQLKLMITDKLIDKLFKEEGCVKLAAHDAILALGWENFSDDQILDIAGSYLYWLTTENLYVNKEAKIGIQKIPWHLFSNEKKLLFARFCFLKLLEGDNSCKSAAFAVLIILPWELFSKNLNTEIAHLCIGALQNEDENICRSCLYVLRVLPLNLLSTKVVSVMEGIFLKNLGNSDELVKTTALEALANFNWDQFTPVQTEMIISHIFQGIINWHPGIRQASMILMRKMHLHKLPVDKIEKFLHDIIEELRCSDISVAARILFIVPWSQIPNSQLVKIVEIILSRSDWMAHRLILPWDLIDRLWNEPSIERFGLMRVKIMLRQCIDKGTVIYFDHASSSIIQIDSENKIVLLDNIAFYNFLQKSLHDLKELIGLPDFSAPNYLIKEQRLSSSRYQLQNSQHLRQEKRQSDICESETSEIYKCHLVSFEIRVQIQNITEKSITLVLVASHFLSVEQLISVRDALKTFLRTQFENHLIDIQSSDENRLKIMGNQDALLNIKTNLGNWLQSDFPRYYSDVRDDLPTYFAFL